MSYQNTKRFEASMLTLTILTGLVAVALGVQCLMETSASQVHREVASIMSVSK